MTPKVMKRERPSNDTNLQVPVSSLLLSSTNMTEELWKNQNDNLNNSHQSDDWTDVIDNTTATASQRRSPTTTTNTTTTSLSLAEPTSSSRRRRRTLTTDSNIEVPLEEADDPNGGGQVEENTIGQVDVVLIANPSFSHDEGDADEDNDVVVARGVPPPPLSSPPTGTPRSGGGSSSSRGRKMLSSLDTPSPKTKSARRRNPNPRDPDPSNMTTTTPTLRRGKKKPVRTKQEPQQDKGGTPTSTTSKKTTDRLEVMLGQSPSTDMEDSQSLAVLAGSRHQPMEAPKPKQQKPPPPPPMEDPSNKGNSNGNSSKTWHPRSSAYLSPQLPQGKTPVHRHPLVSPPTTTKKPRSQQRFQIQDNNDDSNNDTEPEQEETWRTARTLPADLTKSQKKNKKASHAKTNLNDWMKETTANRKDSFKSQVSNNTNNLSTKSLASSSAGGIGVGGHDSPRPYRKSERRRSTSQEPSSTLERYLQQPQATSKVSPVSLEPPSVSQPLTSSAAAAVDVPPPPPMTTSGSPQWHSSPSSSSPSTIQKLASKVKHSVVWLHGSPKSFTEETPGTVGASSPPPAAATASEQVWEESGYVSPQSLQAAATAKRPLVLLGAAAKSGLSKLRHHKLSPEQKNTSPTTKSTTRMIIKKGPHHKAWGVLEEDETSLSNEQKKRDALKLDDSEILVGHHYYNDDKTDKDKSPRTNSKPQLRTKKSSRRDAYKKSQSDGKLYIDNAEQQRQQRQTKSRPVRTKHRSTTTPPPPDFYQSQGHLALNDEEDHHYYHDQEDTSRRKVRSQGSSSSTRPSPRSRHKRHAVVEGSERSRSHSRGTLKEPRYGVAVEGSERSRSHSRGHLRESRRVGGGVDRSERSRSRHQAVVEGSERSQSHSTRKIKNSPRDRPYHDGEMHLNDRPGDSEEHPRKSRSSKPRSRSQTKYRTGDNNDNSQSNHQASRRSRPLGSRSASPHGLRHATTSGSGRPRERPSRSSSPGKLRGTVTRKREAMQEIRKKRASVTGTTKLDRNDSIPQATTTSAGGGGSPILHSRMPRPPEVFPYKDESLEDLVKKVRQKASEKQQLQQLHAQDSGSDEEDLPVSYRANARPSVPLSFQDKLEW